MTDSTVSFAREAAAFRDWALQPKEKNEATARQALVHILGLYRAAIFLPQSCSEENRADDNHRVKDAEWKQVHDACSRLPFHYYSEILDPFLSPPEAPEVGNLADNIAHIYQDVITGLSMYEAGKTDEAVREWNLTFSSHWGNHATSAIRAIHCYLTAKNQET